MDSLRRPLLTLAALNFDLPELSTLARFVDVATYDSNDTFNRTNATSLAAIIARRTGDDARAVELGTLAAQSYRLAGRPLLEARALETAGRLEDAHALYVRYGAVGYAKALRIPANESVPSRDTLSEREREVAEYVSLGLGNLAIAERLSISKKTVEKHIASIFDKLGVRSRARLAGLIANQKLSSAVRTGADAHQ